MKLKSAVIKDFLGVREMSLSFGDRLTLIYGANGTGKSSIVDAVRFALTAQAVRGYRLGDMVRRGAKSLEVEVQLDGINVIRRQTTSGDAERFVNGVEMKAEDVAVEIARSVGVNATVLDAALRAGALLELKALDLQRLLLALCGGAVDNEAIVKAIGLDVASAAKRADIALPASLDGFASVAAKAEAARREAKRTLAALEGDLARMPRPSAPATAQDRGALSARVSEIEAQLERAIAAKALGEGAHAERLRAKRARLAALQAVEKPRGDAESLRTKLERLRDSVASDRENSGAVRERVRHLQERLIEARKRAGNAKPGPREDATAAGSALEVARTAAQDAAGMLVGLEAVGSSARAAVESAQVEGCTHGCTVHCLDLEKAEAALKAAKVEYSKAAKARKAADADLVKATARAAEAEAASYASDADAYAQEIEKLRGASADAERSASLADEIRTLERLVAQHAAFAKTVGEIAALQDEIAKLALEPSPAAVPPGDSVDEVRTTLAKARADVEAFDAVAAAASVGAKIARAKTMVSDCDAVAQACGPGGSAKIALLAQVLGPFLVASNEAFALLLPGTEVVFDTDGELALAFRVGGETFPVEAISEGQRAIFRYALQYAVAKLAKVGVLILDHAEAVDARGRTALKKLVAACGRQGIQAVLLTCAEPPEAAPPGARAYRVQAGTATEIPGGAR